MEPTASETTAPGLPDAVATTSPHTSQSPRDSADAAGSPSGAPTMPTGPPRGADLSEFRPTWVTVIFSPATSRALAWLSTGRSSPPTNRYRAPVSLTTTRVPGLAQPVEPPGLIAPYKPITRAIRTAMNSPVRTPRAVRRVGRSRESGSPRSIPAPSLLITNRWACTWSRLDCM